MKQDTFTKEHTQIAKGLAMILMLFDHLFWLWDEPYISIFPQLPDRNTVEWAFGSVGNICVSMFLILSGYGMYCTTQMKENYTWKDSFIRIRKLWENYALITIIFIVIDLICGKIKFDWVKILLNIFALDYTYNKFAWFMSTYIVIMLVFPFLWKLYRNQGWVWKVATIVGIKVGITVIYHVLCKFTVVPEMLYRILIEPFMFLPTFLIGYICAEYHVFEWLYRKYFQGKGEKLKLGILLIGIFVFMYLCQYTILDHVTAPALCFLIAYLCQGNWSGKALAFVGKHSTNMWLIHYSIMVLMGGIVYAPRFSVMILIFILIILIPICFFLEFLLIRFDAILDRKWT